MNTVLQFYIVALVFGYLAGITFGQVKFVPQDCWIGLYWKTEQQMAPGFCKMTTWYLCIIPCLPIIWITKSGN